MVTVLEEIYRDGSSLDPMIIFKAKKMISESFKGIARAGVPEGVLFGRSPNSWTDDRFSMIYLQRQFRTGSDTEKKAKDNWSLLIFDDHTYHVNPRFLEFTIDIKIIPFCFPPYCTHRLQPLDVSIFSS
jgi:hypothetical protein